MPNKTRATSGGKKRWKDMINKSVPTTDDVDIGDVDALSHDVIVAKRGYLKRLLLLKRR